MKYTITDIYAFIFDGPEGEGIMSFFSPQAGGWVPLMGFDLEHVSLMRDRAIEMSSVSHLPHRLMHYTLVSELHPKGH